MASIFSSMPGRVVEIKVQVGQEVTAGQELCTLEAMKMQMPVSAPHNGVVKEIKVSVGQGIRKGDTLIELE